MARERSPRAARSGSASVGVIAGSPNSVASSAYEGDAVRSSGWGGDADRRADVLRSELVRGRWVTKNNSLTGLDIKSIQSGDIKDRSIKLRDLNAEVLKAIQSGSANAGASTGTPGAAGANGANGGPGPQGPAGQNGKDATISSGNWGVQSRNTIGSPDIDLRGGPATPPFGSGSLKFLVGSGPPLEKAAYGNEQDFFGQPVSGLTDVGFRVYTTGENNALGNPNMPSITFEIDPNLTATPSNFSSAVFVPNNSASNAWSPYIDATQAASGFWFLTGAAGTATGCNQTTTCSFAAMQTALADGGDAALILTAGVTKGRDFAWQGAIDGLRINAQVFDFEETGVTARPAA